MRCLIMGMGHIGKALAARLRAGGHSVVGTTTTPGKVEALRQHAEEVVVLRGNESAKVIAAARNCEQIIVTVAPNVKNTRTIEERHRHYQEVLVQSCDSARQAGDNLLFLSSFSVYGDGGKGSDPITEETPTGNHEEPSSRYYQEAEQHILSAPGGCVLRFPDMYGAPGDLSFPERVAMCHQYFDGKAIFSAHAPLYAIHFEDVVAAVLHSVEHQLTGIYNVCDNERLPSTNQQVFDAICAEQGMAPLQFLDQIKAPLRRISSQRIYNTGYRVQHTDPNQEVVKRHAG